MGVQITIVVVSIQVKSTSAAIFCHICFLQSNKDHKHFGKACRAELERYEQESAKDYRLNFRLYTACKADVGQLCKDACKLQDGEICGGKVNE